MTRAFIASLLITLSVVLPGAERAFAQTSVTPEQIRQFQALPPAQRNALMRQLGIGGVPMASPAQPSPARASGGFPPLLDMLPAEAGEELRITGGESLVITTKLKAAADEGAVKTFMQDSYRSRLLGSHLIELDERGVMEIPGIATIPLAGLSAEQIAVRLGAEALLAPLKIEVTILPLTPIGTDALEPFGYALFGSKARGYAGEFPDSYGGAGSDGLGAFGQMPLPSMPVPRDYILGPGDTVHVQLYGNENYEIDLQVNHDGTINFPKLGPKSVVGLTFGELKASIENRVDEQLIGTETSITMGALRSIRVFVVGDVKRPGAYTMSSLARITNALFYAGGITEVGSLRHVQLKRSGQLIKTLDLYDLLLRGDTNNDAQLRADDVVFIPPVKTMVGIDGEINRPAIYELRSERTVTELINLAGGLLPTADSTSLEMQRVNQRGTRSVETIDLMEPAEQQFALQAGDLITVYPVREEVQDAVFLSGHVNRPGGYEWSPGMRIADLLPSSAYLKPMADLAYVLIRREQGADRQALIASVDLEAVWSEPASAANAVLQARDRIMVFELGVRRTAAVQGLLDELTVQSTHENPLRAVRIRGEVRAAGTYPLETQMHISDLVRAGGGLKAGAYTTEAELTRYIIDVSGKRQTRLIEVDLVAALAGSPEADLVLGPYDYLNIRSVPDWEGMFEVELVGEVRFPGGYPVRNGETLGSVIARAGGLTELAFPQGAVFTRESLQEREAEQLEILTSRLEADLAGLSLRAAADPTGDTQQAMSAGQGLLARARATETTGRLVIELETVVVAEPGGAGDIDLRDGDKLYVPRRAQEVTVLGEVQYTTSHLYDHERSRDGYIDLSGGLTINADKKRIYVVRANGAVQAGKRSRWFRGSGTTIYPGDTIVVPTDTDRMPKLVQWTSVTQILFQMAIAVAAVNSF